MQAKGKLLDLSLLTLAIVGPALYLVGLLTRGLTLLQGDLTRVGFTLGLLSLSAGAGAFMAFRRAEAALRLLAAGMVVLNLGAVAYSWTRWNADMARAEAEALLQPIPLDKIGLLLAPVDHSPEAAGDLRAVEEVIDDILSRNGIAGAVEIRRTYPLGSVEQARSLAVRLGAHIVAWQEIEGGRHPSVRQQVLVLGAHDTGETIETLEMLRLMATQERFVLSVPLGAGSEPSRLATEVLGPVVAGFGALGAGRPVVAATQFRNALQAEGLPDHARATLQAYRGTALLHADREDLALPEFEEAVALYPSAYGWAAMGNAYVAARDWSAAEIAYQRAIALDSYYALPYCGLGIILARERDVSGAVSAYHQAIALAPDWAAPHALLALAHELRGDATAAQEEYQYCVAKAGPNGSLQEAAAQRAQRVVEHPPTAIPTATPRPTPTITPIPTSGVYQVRKGDTLAAIADRLGVPMDRIIEVNRLDNPHALSVGQILIIPELP